MNKFQPFMNRYSTIQNDLNRKRSTFNLGYPVKTTFPAGKLIPFGATEVLPGDTFTDRMSFVMRSLTPVVPVMDNAYFDLWAFFVPSRLCAKANGDDWEAIQGDNKNGPWAPSVESKVTMFDMSDYHVGRYSVPNYFGLPIGESNAYTGKLINPYPIIAYGLIWNNFFRNENTQNPITDWTGFLEDCFSTSIDALLPVCRLHDVFSTALPQPQKGEASLIPAELPDSIPITAAAELHSTGRPIMFRDQANSVRPITSSAPLYISQFKDAGLAQPGVMWAKGTSSVSDQPTPDMLINQTNLNANLRAHGGISIDVNAFRLGTQIQRALERDARGGTRYLEALRARFGVQASDARLAWPEYLGGKRQAINVTQVLQTSQSSEGSPLGLAGAFSYTADNAELFSKSFVEHGYIILVGAVRVAPSYSQGIEKMWTKCRRFDFYEPVFAHLGEQPIHTTELYAPASNDLVFGYTEAWYEYRQKQGLVTGSLAPNAQDASYAPFTYTNNFSTVPTLVSFAEENPANYSKTLVNTTTNDHFVIDMDVSQLSSRVMPVKSDPGLVDHF